MKQTAGISAAKAESIKADILANFKGLVASPSEMLAALRKYTEAGFDGSKFQIAEDSYKKSVRAALAMFASAEDLAKLNVDVLLKMQIKPSELDKVNNMVLKAGRDGRFEAKDFAANAPKILNTASVAGMTGLTGMALVSALTQQAMQLAPADQKAEVSTFMQHFFGHLTDAHYVKGLAKKGIRVQDFYEDKMVERPDGVPVRKKRLKGEGGLDGLLGLLNAFAAKRIDDPFEASKAGFREQYTKQFMIQLVGGRGVLSAAVKDYLNADKEDLIGKSIAEIKQSSFAKIKQAEIAKESAQVGSKGTTATNAWAGMIEWASDNPVKASAADLGTFFGGRAALKQFGFFGGNGNGKDAGALNGVAGTLGAQKVMVMNWPSELGGKPTFRKAVVDGATGAGTAAALAQGAGALASLGVGAGVVAPVVATAAAIGYGFEKFAQTKTGITGQQHKVDGQLGQAIRRLNLEKQMGGKNTYEASKLESQIKRLEGERGKLDAQLKALEEAAKRPIQVVLRRSPIGGNGYIRTLIISKACRWLIRARRWLSKFVVR